MTMDDKVILAAAKAEKALTEEQKEVAAELGWQPLPHPIEGYPVTLLVRPVQTEDEAYEQYFALKRDRRMLNLVSEPYSQDPLHAPVWTGAPLVNAHDPESTTPDPPPSDDATKKPSKPTEEPEKDPVKTSEAFPDIPEYIWKTLKPDSQDELVKKLVEYRVDRSDAAAYGSSFDDAALFAHLEVSERSGLAKQVIEQKHGMAAEQVRREALVNEFQTERVNLMKKAVITAGEVNLHLMKWRDLSGNVWPLLRLSSIIAGVFVLVSFALVFVGRISGWELAVLAFVFALMAVSPATLLLIGRPLKGLDEWSPSKQEKKADEAAKDEPAKDKAKPEK